MDTTTFRFTALGTSGETCEGTIEAQDARAACAILRSRGLFVTKVTQEGVDDPDQEGDREPMASGNNASPWIYASLLAVGLAMTLTAVYGVIESLRFDLWGERVDATVISQKPSGEGGCVSTLQITVDRRVLQDAARGAYGCRWINDCPPVGKLVRVLYLPARRATRLAAFLPLYAIPLMVLWFGSVFTLAGIAGYASNYPLWLRRVLVTAFWVVFACGGAAPLVTWLLGLW